MKLIGQYKDSPSLISRDASTAIKGLLMLLIVFGHTAMLTTNFATGERTFFWQWLYTFHVYVFFILPFIYGYQRKDAAITLMGGVKFVDFQYVVKDLKYNLIKIGVPYCWFFLFSAIVFVTVGGGRFDWKGMLYAFFFGNEPLMDKYIGFNFMWFLPAMLALTTLKSVYYNSNSKVKVGIVVVSLTLWFFSIFNVFSQYKVGMYVPFAISQAFYFIILGLTARWLLEKHFLDKWQIPAVVLLIGICTVLLYYYNELSGPNLNVYTAARLFMPILVFLFLYGIRNLLDKSKVLKFIGIYSLQIYLVHVFVLNVLARVFLHFIHQNTGLGIVVYVISILLSITIAMLLEKSTWLNGILFPKAK